MNKLSLFLKGMAMGAADVVPGVSGGTIAFISGIYEELLLSIKSVHPKLLLVLKNEGFAAFWEKINGTFLLILATGILTSVVSLAKLIEYVLHNHPTLLWSFFFGLILASVWYIGKQVEKWPPPAIIALIAGALIAFGITLAVPAQAPTGALFVFLSGCIAICAMILPGISGSFMLLLMGMYPTILGAVNDRDIATLGIFGLGCIVGLLSFSHLLSWMFKHYRNTTLALLTGFMIGSLNKVWPWKETLQTRINSHGEEEPFIQANVLPQNFLEVSGQDPQTIFCILLFFVGIAAVLGLEFWAGSQKKANG